MICKLYFYNKRMGDININERELTDKRSHPAVTLFSLTIIIVNKINVNNLNMFLPNFG